MHYNAAMTSRRRFPISVAFFLLPNLVGFLGFTLFPVLFSLWMSFTNWSLKPAVEFEVLGARNYADLMGVRALADPFPSLWLQYMACATALLLGLVLALWGGIGGWRGTRVGGVVLSALSLTILARAVEPRGGDVAFVPQATAGLIALCGGMVGLMWSAIVDRPSTPVNRILGVSAVLIGLVLALSAVRPRSTDAAFIAAAILGAAGVVSICRAGESWRLGLGMLGPALIAAAALGLAVLHRDMWAAYEPKDARFWQYFYNTVYLMLGIPFGIAGSLGLALLVNNDLQPGGARTRVIGALLCLACGAVSLALVWGLGWHNVALLCGVFWLVVALGVAFDVVAYRTIYYLPTFTAGVALMILWKALYNPETGPINAALTSVLSAFGWDVAAPKWLTDVHWAKPALIIMGVWTGIGGTNMLLYLAGLSNVPRDLLDAAEVDGAGMWARFRHVSWPQLAPTTFFISIMAIIGGLQGGFDQARVMTGGGPAGATTTLSYYIYNMAFQDLDLGYAAAISWVLFAIIFTATALNWRFGKELEVGA